MHRLNELAAKLSPDQIQEVEDFAEFLIAHAGHGTTTAALNQRGNGIDVDKLMGLCKGMGGDKSDKELIREAWDEIVAKYE